MSGPKVVRIVTREELVARCERWLRRFERAYEIWLEQIGKLPHGVPADADKYRPDLKRLRGMIRANQFDQVETIAERQIEFLSNDIQDRRQKAAEKIASAKTRMRRLVTAASTLQASLREADAEIDGEVVNQIEMIVSGREADPEAAAGIVARGMALLSGLSSSSELTQDQTALVKALGSDSIAETLAEWAVNSCFADDALGQRIDGYIADMELRSAPEAIESYRERASAIAVETDTNRRRLLADSLIIEMAEETRRMDQLEKEREQLKIELACLEAIDDSAADALRAQAPETLSSQSMEAVTGLLSDIQIFLGNFQENAAAAAGRRVVLSALDQLGYAVNEDMEAAWIENGMVVMGQKESSNYGLQLSGGQPGNPVQMRVAAEASNASARTHEADVTAEEEWCSSFQNLDPIISASGANMELIASEPVGATPLVETNISDGRQGRVDRIRTAVPPRLLQKK